MENHSISQISRNRINTKTPNIIQNTEPPNEEKLKVELNIELKVGLKVEKVEKVISQMYAHRTNGDTTKAGCQRDTQRQMRTGPMAIRQRPVASTTLQMSTERHAPDRSTE